MPTAITVERAIANPGLVVSARAAAGGPIIRLKISVVPTTGTVMVVASATSSRNATSILNGLKPWVLSGSTDASSSGRQSVASTTRQTTVSAIVGHSSELLTPSTSPNSSE